MGALASISEIPTVTLHHLRRKMVQSCSSMQLRSCIAAFFGCFLFTLEARQLDSSQHAVQSIKQMESQHSVQTYQEALAKSSCHEFLLGIGTQKGGTTALWTYIADGAHPHLRVTATKELGFWDNMHTRYIGCGLGDYLQLVTPAHVSSNLFPGPSHVARLSNASKPEAPPQIPLCPSVTTRLLDEKNMSLGGPKIQGVSPDVKTISSTKRLAVSPVCAVQRNLQQQAISLKPPDKQVQETVVLEAHPPNKGRPPSANPAQGSARLLQQSVSSGDFMIDSSLGSVDPQVYQLGTTEVSTIIGAPSRLRLPQPPHKQPMVHADITPRYMFDPSVPLRVRSLLPEARIIILLRDPVARAVSNFNMWWQKQAAKQAADRPPGTWSDTLAAQVDAEIVRITHCHQSVDSRVALHPELLSCLGLSDSFSPGYDEALFANRLLAQGLYADQLQHWFHLFPAESFLIWVSEDFKSDPVVHMQQLVQWLGLNTAQLSPKLRHAGGKLLPVHGRHYEGSASTAVISRMRQFFALHNERLFELLETKGFGTVAARMQELWSQ